MLFKYFRVSIFVQIIIATSMDKYGLIGHPLKHSFSQRFFFDKFEKEQTKAIYNNYDIPDIKDILQIIQETPDLKGFNVTIPYKEQIIQFLDQITPEAKAIGAVNVVKIERIGTQIKLIGYNSDIIGFRESIRPLIKPDIHRKALILGTGGASKAICKALEELNITHQYVSRSSSKNSITYTDLTKDIMDDYTLIINCTPLGTFPDIDNAPAIPYRYINKKHLLFDLVYNPEETKFLRLGKEQGATTKNGYEMLVLQALASWEFWNSK